MDPSYEQRLRDEVLYLHSLFHHGHPRPPPSVIVNLQPSNPTRFKKPKKKTPKPKKHNIGKFSGKEWPVPPPPADPQLNQSGWPELKLKPKHQPTRVPTPEELEKHKWNQVQQRALSAANHFYSESGELSDEDDEEEDDDDDDNDDDMIGDGDNVDDKVLNFFKELFIRDEELKGYYLKHCGGGGEFLCLVCCGANENIGKRFRDCIALVQHSVSVAKTKKVRSHRAYGRVICSVLGWEIDKLPSSIVSDHNNNNNSKSSELQGNDVNDLNSDDVKGTVDGESMVCEDISTVANVEEENNKNPVLKEAEGCAGGAVNNLCRNLSSTMVLEQVPGDLQTS